MNGQGCRCGDESSERYDTSWDGMGSWQDEAISLNATEKSRRLAG